MNNSANIEAFTSKRLAEKAAEGKQAMDNIISSINSAKQLCNSIGSTVSTEDSNLGEAWYSLIEPLEIIKARYDDFFNSLKEIVDDYVERTVENENMASEAASQIKSRISNITSNLK